MTTTDTDFAIQTTAVNQSVKWTDGMRSDLLKLFSYSLQNLGEETFWECFDVLKEEFEFFLENRQEAS